jgi:hypothetical protein
MADKPTNSGVGKQLPQLHIHGFDWIRDWVMVIMALHHAFDMVEQPSLYSI